MELETPGPAFLPLETWVGFTHGDGDGDGDGCSNARLQVKAPFISFCKNDERSTVSVKKHHTR